MKGEKGVRADAKRENRNIVHITFAVVLLFIVMTGYIGSYTYFKAPDFINSPYNLRQELLAKRVIRGQILSRNREILARTVTAENGEEERSYPYKNLFAHAVGYSDRGKSGVELMSNLTLLTSDDYLPDRVSNILNGRKNNGNNVVTTLDINMQAAAYEALGDFRGAIIALDARTGAVLCMVSKPDFDPESIAESWDAINADPERGALVNRCTQGLYPPGSTFKIVTMLEYLKENSDEELKEFSFDCGGSFSKDGYTINCYHGRNHGIVDINTAFSESCNSAFAYMGTSFDRSGFKDTCEKLLFNRELPLKFPYNKSYVPIGPGSDTGEVMQTAIGQGKMQTTPMHMAMITQAIANGGVLMTPYIIDHIENSGGDVIKSFAPKEYGRIIEKEHADRLCELMEEVVRDGTATRLKSDSFTAAGKTGSAEYSSNKVMSHAWFTCFAPVQDPEVVVTVIAEEAGSGGQFAVPMAKSVLDAWF